MRWNKKTALRWRPNKKHSDPIVILNRVFCNYFGGDEMLYYCPICASRDVRKVDPGYICDSCAATWDQLSWFKDDKLFRFYRIRSKRVLSEKRLPEHHFVCQCGASELVESVGHVVSGPICCGRPMREIKISQGDLFSKKSVRSRIETTKKG